MDFIFEAYQKTITPKEKIERVDEKSFLRLPGHVIGNELYQLKKAVDAFHSSQTNGNDVDMKQLNALIKLLNDIKKKAKSFSSEEDVPVSYQYKKNN